MLGLNKKDFGRKLFTDSRLYKLQLSRQFPDTELTDCTLKCSQI
jgi:hypothetical protein